MHADDIHDVKQWASDRRWDKAQYVACLALDPEGETVDIIRAHSQLPILTLDAGGSSQPNTAGVEVFSTFEQFTTAIRNRALQHQRCEALVTGWAADQFPDGPEQFGAALSSAHAEADSERITRYSNVHDWVRLLMSNVPQMVGRTVLNRIKHSCDDMPVIIVGAGPSLAKNIDTVGALQQRGACAVFAVNTALPALAAAGIKPDAVFVAESKPRVMKDFIGVDLTNTTLIGGIHVPAALDDLDVASRWLAVTASAGIGNWLQELTGAETITNGGSVSTVALSAAIHLGCDPIVMVGMDCAHDIEGGHHAPGTNRGDYASEVRDAKVYDCDLEYRNESGRWLPARKVAGWCGYGEVVAPMCLDSYRQWFEYVAHIVAASPKPRLLANCTEGGARIDGFEELPLEDFTWLWPEGPTITDRLRAAECLAPPLGTDELRQGLRSLEGRAGAAAKLARKATRYIISARDAERRFQAAMNDIPLCAAWAQVSVHKMNESTAGEKPLDRIAAAVGVAGETIEKDVAPLVRAALREVDHGRI